MIKNTASQKVGVQMVSAADGSAFTGSVTVAVTGDAGTQATGSVGSGACAHEGNGYHTYAPAQAETNYDLVAFTFTGTGAVPQTVQVYTRAATPDVNVSTVTANALTASALAADAVTEIQSGLATAAALAVVDGIVDDILVDTAEIGAAGAGLTNINLPNQTMDIVGNITGNLSGSVGSVTGAVGSVTGAVGSVTGNVGGNVVGSVGSVTAGVTLANDAITAAKFDETTAWPLTAADTGSTAVARTGADSDTLETLSDQLDTKASQSSVDDLPTNAELATSQAAADDATLAAIAALNDLDATEVQTAVNAALVALHLDHILAVTYDPASKPGAADALFNELVENDGGVARYTANALEQGPGGGSAPTAAQIADAVWLEAIADHSGTTGSTAEALNAAGAAGDPWTTALPGAYGSGSAGKIIGDNINATISSRASQTSVDDLPTNAELATSQASADDATLAAIAALNNLSAGQVRTELSTELGRIDVAVSTRASQSSVDDVPTNAELATALGTADDAVLTQVALVKAKTDLIPSDPADQSAVEAAITAATSPLATAANLATLDTVADAILAMLDDARSEPGQGAPPVNPDMATKVDYLYKLMRNKIEQTASELKVYADDGTTVDHKATVSDDATTYTRGELATGV